MTAIALERLHALLDVGLDQASSEELAWLASQRHADAAFDAEVRVQLALQAQLAAWGAQPFARGPSDVATDAALGGALAGIFDGIDAGLYDDGLALDAAPVFDEAVPARAVERPGRVVRLLRDNRVAQVLAAAAALLLVVTAGLSAVRVSSPAPSESAVSASAAAPAASVAPQDERSQAPAYPTGGLALPTPAAPVQEAAEEGPELAQSAQREVQEPAGGRAPQGSPAGFGSGAASEVALNPALADIDDRPAASARGAAVSTPRGQALADGVLLQGAGAAASRTAPGATESEPAGGSASRSFRSSAANSADRVAERDAPSDPTAGGPTAPSAERAELAAASAAPPLPTPAPLVAPSTAAPPPARYRTWTALRPALAACLAVGREVTVEVAARSGAVRVLSAPAASASELRCLERVARQSALAPPPSVTRQLRVARAGSAAVPDTSTQ